jgi:hypothetical protein
MLPAATAVCCRSHPRAAHPSAEEERRSGGEEEKMSGDGREEKIMSS